MVLSVQIQLTFSSHVPLDYLLMDTAHSLLTILFMARYNDHSSTHKEKGKILDHAER